MAQRVEEVAQVPLAAEAARDHPRAPLELLADRGRLGGLVHDGVVLHHRPVALLYDLDGLHHVADEIGRERRVEPAPERVAAAGGAEDRVETAFVPAQEALVAPVCRPARSEERRVGKECRAWGWREKY